MPIKQPPKQKRKILHLGNVGEDKAYRSKRLAHMCPDIQFYGIDLKKITNSRVHHPSVLEDTQIHKLRESRLKLDKPKNLIQFQENFIKGLLDFPDNHLDIITSDFAVGYYDQRVTTRNLKKKAVAAYKVNAVNVYTEAEKYTIDVINLIYNKLKPKGKFIAYYFIDRNRINTYFGFNLKTAINKSKFLYVKEEKVDITKMPPEFRSLYTTHLRDSDIYRIVAIKE